MFNQLQLFHNDSHASVSEDITLSTFNINQPWEMKFDPAGSTYIVFISGDKIEFKTEKMNISVSENLYFSCATPFNIKLNKGRVIIALIKEQKYNLNLGQIDYLEGKLKYIDGCSDSILIAPLKKGLPCLNYLYFPKGTNQTKHFHPSFRFGLVTAGEGLCDNGEKLISLKQGDFFFIPKDAPHRFVTEDQKMSVIAFHPDSDWGPQDENHPMINRTWFK